MAAHTSIQRDKNLSTRSREDIDILANGKINMCSVVGGQNAKNWYFQSSDDFRCGLGSVQLFLVVQLNLYKNAFLQYAMLAKISTKTESVKSVHPIYIKQTNSYVGTVKRDFSKKNGIFFFAKFYTIGVSVFSINWINFH